MDWKFSASWSEFWRQGHPVYVRISEQNGIPLSLESVLWWLVRIPSWHSWFHSFVRNPRSPSSLDKLKIQAEVTEKNNIWYRIQDSFRCLVCVCVLYKLGVDLRCYTILYNKKLYANYLFDWEFHKWAGPARQPPMAHPPVAGRPA